MQNFSTKFGPPYYHTMFINAYCTVYILHAGHPSAGQPQFSAGDPRSGQIVRQLDPRYRYSPTSELGTGGKIK